MGCSAVLVSRGADNIFNEVTVAGQAERLHKTWGFSESKVDQQSAALSKMTCSMKPQTICGRREVPDIVFTFCLREENV